MELSAEAEICTIFEGERGRGGGGAIYANCRRKSHAPFFRAKLACPALLVGMDAGPSWCNAAAHSRFETLAHDGNVAMPTTIKRLAML